MTKAREIRELLKEQGSGPGERQALETLAETLEESLAHDVPFRPEFKAQLRQQLMAEARRTLTPWYRRPALWGSSMAVAAAAAVLVVGLQMYQKAPLSPPEAAPNNPPVAQGPKTTTGTGPDQSPFPVAEVVLRAVALPDDPLDEATLVPGGSPKMDLSKGLKFYVMSGQTDAEHFKRVAEGLGFTQAMQQDRNGFWVTEGARTLSMTTDGHVLFTDRSAAEGSSTPLDSDGARAATRRFLDRAALPVPDLQPTVTVEAPNGLTRVYTVTYTPRVDGMPVVNARTVVQVTEQNRVIRAEAYVYARTEEQGYRPAVAPSQALTWAKERGAARFDGQADLVYVRTISEQSAYLQPYWRVLGTSDQGARIARYVPALAQ